MSARRLRSGLAVVVASLGCAAMPAGARLSDGEMLTRSYFPIGRPDGRCAQPAARRGQSLADYGARTSGGEGDLDCVARLRLDDAPVTGQLAVYYYYRTYLFIRARGGRLDDLSIDELLRQTGLKDAPPSGQVLSITASLFGSKDLAACNRDLSEQATRFGGLIYADRVNDAQRRIGTGPSAQTCTHPAALAIVRRAAATAAPSDQPDTAGSGKLVPVAADDDARARSFFPSAAFDGRCGAAQRAKVGEPLSLYLARVRPAKTDLDCVVPAIADPVTAGTSPDASYHYYQTYLVLRAMPALLAEADIAAIAERTGIAQAPPTGENLLVAAGLFFNKERFGCAFELARRAAGRKMSGAAASANEALNAATMHRQPPGCTEPAALGIIARADQKIGGL